MILSLDPGGTTGWATYYGRMHGGRPDALDIDCGEWGPGPHHVALWDAMQAWSPDIIVCERFLYQRREITKGVSLVLDSKEYIGVARLWCELEEDAKFVEQTPAQAKNLWTDDKLKKLGLWKAQMPHAMDAVRHLLYHLVVTEGETDWLEPLRPS